MGSADVVPGVSGGTIAFITGIYDELISTLGNINLSMLKLILKGDLKGLETIHKKIIQLPSSPNLSTKNLKKVIDKITNFFS